MTETISRNANAITLKGSAKLVIDYLRYGINSILYTRGIYPPESFKMEEHFGLSIYMSADDKIHAFLDSVLGQLKEWLLAEKIKKLSLIVTSITTKEVLEKWDFKLSYEAPKDGNPDKKEEVVGNKDLKVIQKEIRDVLRQICSMVSFLPLLDSPCSFDVLVYADSDAEVPDKWDETGPCFIANSQELQLRCFSTSLHKMETVVSFKGQ